MRRAVVPLQLAGVTRQRLAGPLLRQIGRFGVRVPLYEQLPVIDVAARRAPLEVGTDHAVVRRRRSVRLAIGDEHADERQADARASRAPTNDRRPEILRREIGSVRSRQNHAAAAGIVRDERGVAHAAGLSR